MKSILLFSLALVCQVSLSQNQSQPVKYKYGQNGIELIVKKDKETIVVSTFQAKMTIKDEIAEKVYAYYNENKSASHQEIKIEGNSAKITGKYDVVKKGNLTSVNFIYDKVEWKDGLVEVSY